MVNATEMAKKFGKKSTDWTKTESSKRFMKALSEVKNINSSDLVQVTYGNNGGTWMHEDVAIEFGESRKVKGVQVFDNPQFGQIRTAGTAENPLFCLADICRVLELRVDGVTPRLKKDGYNRIGVIDSLGRHQEAIFVNEQNLYKVIMRSDKPQAEPFQDWVCGEVLPSIRKTGSYSIQNLSRKELALMVIQAEEGMLWSSKG